MRAHPSLHNGAKKYLFLALSLERDQLLNHHPLMKHAWNGCLCLPLTDFPKKRPSTCEDLVFFLKIGAGGHASLK